MRLIDADALEPHEIYDDNGFTEVVYMDDIREMPTVEADVVRCKDCIYAKPYNQIWQLPIHDGLVCTNFGNEEVDKNFFCGCAIKKMDENEKFDNGFFCGCAIKKLDMKGEEDE